jgi:hypothetical protein
LQHDGQLHELLHELLLIDQRWRAIASAHLWRYEMEYWIYLGIGSVLAVTLVAFAYRKHSNDYVADED